ncbi:MAG: acyl--CoA ligase [Moorea sp. SIOASIH]|uniref:class I adenylate-forming enzyme family protein n=1 Tax=Moorena sp. SIOASIH TaxID=2607817 RepID=UPI0013BAD986|nr:class I adenylate-forming enzyme family protein [Moorena sp. SIOASIH]NEO41268.1 acyl--CoA ligase [Moorena sp. SIOASIH]
MMIYGLNVMKKRILTSVLWQAAKRWPERVYLDGDNSYTYAEAASFVYRLAESLKSFGVKRWDRVLIFAKNRPEILLILFAANVVGASVTILHEGSTEKTLRKICSNLEPKAVFLDDTTRSRCNFCENYFNIDREIISDSNSKSFKDCLPKLNDIASRSGAIDTDPALIIYTSGSTGNPKGVVMTQDNVLFVVEKIQSRLSYSSEDTIGLFLPLSFDYGLYQGFIAAQVGARLVVSSSEFAGPLLLKNLRQKNINVLPGVPNLFESLLKILERRKEKLPEIRVATNTGAHLSEQNILRLQNALPNVLLYPMYGLTECKRISILTPEEIKKHPGSVGRALDNTDAFVVDNSGNILPPGKVGELVVCGRHVGLGYWKSPIETQTRYRTHPLEIGRVLYTGDDFKIDEEGYLYFVGRRDEQIKRNGFRIHPLEIETAAVELEEINNASVVQVGDHLALFVVTNKPNLTENTILSKLSDLLEPYKVPDSVKFLKEFPSTSNNKVDRRALAELLSENMSTPSNYSKV